MAEFPHRHLHTYFPAVSPLVMSVWHCCATELQPVINCDAMLFIKVVATQVYVYLFFKVFKKFIIIFLYFFSNFFIFLFIWLCQVLVAACRIFDLVACGIFSCGI